MMTKKLPNIVYDFVLLKLVYKSSAYENKSDASKEEYRIKQLSHKDKLNFIKTN